MSKEQADALESKLAAANSQIERTNAEVAAVDQFRMLQCLGRFNIAIL